MKFTKLPIPRQFRQSPKTACGSRRGPASATAGCSGLPTGRELWLLGWALASFLASQQIHAKAGEDRVEQGATEVKLEWVQESQVESGWQGGVSFGLTQSLQVDLSAVALRDRAASPAGRIAEGGIEFEWWPVQSRRGAARNGLDVGTKLSFGRERERTTENEIEITRSREVALLLKRSFAATSVTWQLDYSHATSGQVRKSGWGTSLTASMEVARNVDIDVEVAKRQRAKPEVEFALSMEIANDLNLVFSIGRQSTATFGAIGLEYSF